MPEQTEEILTIAEVAKKMKVSKMTVFRMIKSKRLSAFKFGNSWRISSLRLSELFRGS